MDKTKLIAAFNEWMRRYTDEPERFARDWQIVQEFLATSDGQTPSYGASCAEYLAELLAA